MNNAKTPSAVSPGSAPGWDPFGQNAPVAQGRPNSRPQPSATAVYDFDPENPGNWVSRKETVSLSRVVLTRTGSKAASMVRRDSSLSITCR